MLDAIAFLGHSIIVLLELMLLSGLLYFLVSIFGGIYEAIRETVRKS